MTNPDTDMEGLVERLNDEVMRLQGRSIDRGCVDSGLSANLAMETADAIETLLRKQAEDAAELKALREELRLWRMLVNEGGVPRYTVTPGAALNTVVTSTDRLLSKGTPHDRE